MEEISVFLESNLAKVSILLTCYNKKEFIRAAESLMKKASQKGCEIIIVDDGSNDGSNFELQRIVEETRSIKFIEQRNQGSASARNMALANASRKYIVFLDLDDSLDLEVLEDGIEFMEKHKTPFGYLNYSTFPKVNANKMKLRVNKPEVVEMKMYRDEIYDSMGYWRYIYTRDILKKEKLAFIPTFEDVGGLFILDDMFWLLHNASLNVEVLVFPENWILYDYFTNPNPSTESWLRFQNQVVLLPKALEVFIEYLDTCSHEHDTSWLVPKIIYMMEAHMKLLNLSQAVAFLPKYLSALENNSGFFSQMEKESKFCLLLKLLKSGSKNSMFKFLSKYNLGEKVLKGYKIVKK